MYELLVSVAIDRDLSRVGDTRFALNTSGNFKLISVQSTSFLLEFIILELC
jgi:hypothetical protein